MNTIQHIMPLHTTDIIHKYMGAPFIMGRSKKEMFNFMAERIWNKLKGWKKKCISFAGRDILIKDVTQAKFLPTL